mmetsp:Transcript_12785/g.11598  ORF Transcript_12785/g.11598 Transcript_12785/m.11598 type:complete len:395 (-) Transcript_12785:45-1229(-)
MYKQLKDRLVNDNKQYNNNVINAAALQSNLSIKYDLPGSKGLIKHKTITRKSNNNSNNSNLCVSCNKISVNKTLCSNCGYFQSNLKENQIETLAHMRGLIKAPSKCDVITKDEWDNIEISIAKRFDAYCPICMSGFNQGCEVLLSCSHIFHQNCLQALEKYMKTGNKSCPICRTNDYQKKITQKGSKAYEIVCCIKIQCVYRGFIARKKYYYLVKQFYHNGNGNVIQRKKFYVNELTNVTNELTKEIDERNNQINDIISSTDVTIAEGKQLDLLFESMLQQRQLLNFYQPIQFDDYSNVDVKLRDYKSNDNHNWNEIIKKSLTRGFGECAICMNPNNCHPYRVLVVLNCSHLFHHLCIDNLEKFTSHNTVISCPVCRCEYSKHIIPDTIIQMYK